ncbi:hypothetical protein A2U01_0010159, partial [Trifolium medium]|nr:hypothetical protein [Trifolium medium]
MVIGGLPIVAFAILNNGPAVVGVLKITAQVIYWYSSTSPFLEVLLVMVDQAQFTYISNLNVYLNFRVSGS